MTPADRREGLRDAGRSLGPSAAVQRAVLRSEGIGWSRGDAELADELLAPGSNFRSAALHVLEVAYFLAGDDGSSDATAAPSCREDPEAMLVRRRWAECLTAAELRVLPLLATHLSFREIGERLYISRHTVKSQALSTYRKLGVSSRSEAVELAVELGLIDATAARTASGPSRRPVVTQKQLGQLTLAVVAIIDGGLAAPSAATV
jgi:DNA-binding CsgD family transcriptional regulator